MVCLGMISALERGGESTNHTIVISRVADPEVWLARALVFGCYEGCYAAMPAQMRADDGLLHENLVITWSSFYFCDTYPREMSFMHFEVSGYLCSS